MKPAFSFPVVALAAVLRASSARADVPPAEPAPEPATAPEPAPATAAPVDSAQPPVAERVPTSDPTGGAYTSPTLLFVPAGALPVWNVRATASTELQSPADVHAAFRPGLGIELGLPAGFTVAAGTNWVGGDINAAGRPAFDLGFSPYFQARFHIYGAADGQGFQLGVAGTYKFVGFEGDPGEVELGLSAQYRHRRFELGLQGVVGKDFASTDADVEAHVYALFRPIPQLGLGAAGQARFAIVSQPDESVYDLIGGAIVSLSLGRFQFGVLGGGSTIGLAQGRAGALGQLFASARF